MHGRITRCGGLGQRLAGCGPDHPGGSRCSASKTGDCRADRHRWGPGNRFGPWSQEPLRRPQRCSRRAGAHESMAVKERPNNSARWASRTPSSAMGGAPAAVLGIPRATATHAIKKLEARLQVRLLERTTRQVRTTVEGQSSTSARGTC
ncbi:helix-turn-helix domain-containing protein [Pseudorhodoferax soli]|uniref:helix-turn-helix domain-containing protein n=1 Tax=Pseudorhodoferax soli TaxID=545864 RepID=UPI003CCC6EC9